MMDEEYKYYLYDGHLPVRMRLSRLPEVFGGTVECAWVYRDDLERILTNSSPISEKEAMERAQKIKDKKNGASVNLSALTKKGYRSVLKYNPYHDESGQFSSASGSVIQLSPANPEDFVKSFEAAFKPGDRFAAYVNHYTVEDITKNNMKCLLSQDGKAGVLIHYHGDGRIEATGLFNRGPHRGAGLQVLAHAIRDNKVNYVECFGPTLPKTYGKIGFKDSEVYPFDTEQAPVGWDYKRNDNPTYHIMPRKRKI